MYLVPYCCPIKTKIGMCPQISAIVSNVKHQENPFIGPRVDNCMQTDGGTDGHGEADTRIIPTFPCECSKKISLSIVFSGSNYFVNHYLR
jgi:hypothetical protein